MSPLFRHEQVVPLPLARTVAFFHDVRNLKRVSPRYPSLEILSADTLVRPGAVIPVRVSMGPFKRTLRTAIIRVDEDGSFTDRLEGGPFSHWEHTHRFESVDGGTRIVDTIEYRTPLWAAPLATLALRIMFCVRRRSIDRVLR